MTLFDPVTVRLCEAASCVPLSPPRLLPPARWVPRRLVAGARQGRRAIPDALADRRPSAHVDQRHDYATPDVEVPRADAGCRRRRARREARRPRPPHAAGRAGQGQRDRDRPARHHAGRHRAGHREGRRVDGSIGRTDEDFGYVRATVPVDAVADWPRSATYGRSTSTASYRIPDPRRRHRAAPPRQGTASRRPARTTPADNPYLPVGETGAIDFVDAPPHLGRARRHRRHPGQRRRPRPPRAAQSTTNGEPKVTDWVTATDPVDRQRRAPGCG